MPIDWNTVPDPRDVGEELLALMGELFPIPRSLTGDGVRQTLAVLAREIPLEIVETPSGTPVFDWTVPREWNLRGAWIEGPDGTRVVDAADSPLHVLGYSIPVDAVVGLDELRDHVFTHASDPDLIPYRTSYWQEQWGFCMSRRQLESLEEGDYRVVVDATLEDGSLTSGEVNLRGATDAEFLLTTHVCHPALANDNLSGVVLLWALAKTLATQKLTHTFRLLWSPGTLGPLCWLARNLETLDRVEHGLVVSCVGDPGPLRYKRSRRGDAQIDRASSYVVARDPANIVSDWQPTGGDERQFCSPGFDLPVGTLSRTPHGLFPEYHSSADNLSLVTADALGAAFSDRPHDRRPARDERELPQSLAVRRASARQARPLPERARRDEPGARIPLGAQPLRRDERPAGDRRAVGSPVRDDPRCSRDTRAARPARANAMSDRVAVVTGASRGIGRATALALGNAGFAVAVVARSAEALEETRLLVEQTGTTAVAVVADVTDPEAVARTVEAIERDAGAISVLVNNAGSLRAIGPLWETDPGDWWSDVMTSLAGAYNFCREVVPRMIARGEGRIVNLTSYAGVTTRSVPERIRMRKGRAEQPDRVARRRLERTWDQRVQRGSRIHADRDDRAPHVVGGRKAVAARSRKPGASSTPSRPLG